MLLRLHDSKIFKLSNLSDMPLRPLPGMFFFEAWRVCPQMAKDTAATATYSEEPPLEGDEEEEDKENMARYPQDSISKEMQFLTKRCMN